MNQPKRLFLLDAFALIFRGYYALIKNPSINSKGMDTSAILGFINSLFELIKKENPDLLAVAFDKGGSSQRTAAFSDYKANRAETPEAISLAVPYIHQILEALNIPIIEKEGFEADDLIGTLAQQAEKEGCQVYMVTPDKDYAQLVTENIFLYRPARMGNGIEIWGVQEVKDKFEVETPQQVIDFLGMMGDAVDNIPGLPGVGEKTAKKFIKDYGSMENLLANTHELKGKMKEKIEENKALGILSKELATIITDCPVAYHEESFTMSTPNFEAVTHLFEELEFRRALDNFYKIFKKETAPVKIDTTSTLPISRILDLFSALEEEHTPNYTHTINRRTAVYQYVNTSLGFQLLLKNLSNQQTIAVEFITENDKFNETIIGICFSYQENTAYYINLQNNNNWFLQKLKPLFENPSMVMVSYDCKKNYKLLQKNNIKLQNNLFDIGIAHYLIQPDLNHQLNTISQTYLSYETIHQEVVLGKGKNKITLSDVDLNSLTNYYGEQTDICLQLYPILSEILIKNELNHLFQEIEIPLLKVLATMETNGITLDIHCLDLINKEISEDILRIENEIYELSGESFNISSPKQLGIVLFEKLKLLEKPKKTKTGQYATGEEILSELAKNHKIAALLLEYRGLVKLKNTYVEALPNEINPNTHKIHTTFNQITAATGRLSSINPNLQNIPIRTEKGKLIRKAFVKQNDQFVLFSADYSQIELRLIAELSKDPQMIQSFNNGEDIHKSTAAKVYNIPLSEVTKEQRSNAKTVNFGIIYGVSAFGLSQQTSLSRKEAKELIDNYYVNFPSLKQFIAQQIAYAQEHGFVKTIYNRRRYLNNINSNNAIVRSADERNAVNAPIQGSAADIIKVAMIQIQDLLIKGNYLSKMLLQVHDELVFDLHKDEINTLIPLIINIMENVIQLSIPLEVDTNYGNNWLDAH